MYLPQQSLSQKNAWGGFFYEIIASSLYPILSRSHWIKSVGFFNQADTETPAFISQAVEAKRHLQPFTGSFAAQLMRHGLLQWGAVVLLLWFPHGNGQLPPALAALREESRSGEDTCATLQDTAGMLKEDVQPQPVLDYEALLARQGKGQHTVTNTDLHFLVMLCGLVLWS